jgi:hypothetical protein
MFKRVKNGWQTEVTNMKDNLVHYKKIVAKGAKRKDGTAYSDFMRGKASGYIEAAADLSRSRKAAAEINARKPSAVIVTPDGEVIKK